MVVWNLTRSNTTTFTTLTAQLVLLDLAYNGLKMAFSAAVSTNKSWVVGPVVEAVVVEPALLIHRVLNVMMI